MNNTFKKWCAVLYVLTLLCFSVPLGAQDSYNVESEPTAFNKKSSTVVIIPDTQGYTSSDLNAEVLQGVMDWIVKNKDKRNIQGVVHVGDMTNNNGKEQWSRIRSCFKVLDNKLPYVICEGNHDVKKRNGEYVDLMNQYFNIEQNKLNRPFFQTSYEPGKLQNASYKMQVNGQEFLFLALEFSPRVEVLEWADQLIKENSNSRIFLTIHDYMSENSRLVSEDGQPEPVKENVGGAKRRTYGMDVYEKLILPNANVEFLVCGHAGAARLRKEGEALSEVEQKAVIKNGKYGYVKEEYFKTFCYDPDIATGHRMDEVQKGLAKHQILFNAQWIRDDNGVGNGGDGWILLLEFHSDHKAVQVKTYSPYLQKWRTGDEYNYILKRSGSI
ncbi:hypothetical protein E9993_22660 [Labilibacter sediminis]|nr:hypothetical protein E9993_22660 [Labilibacter sediminis]